MKKIVLFITLLFVLVGCKPNPKKMYRLKVGNNEQIVVGADLAENISNYSFINDYSIFTDKKEREYLESIEIYTADVDEDIYINETLLSNSIEVNCTNLKGELLNKNGKACLLHKTYKDKENIVILTGDILDENIDRLDRIQVMYK